MASSWTSVWAVVMGGAIATALISPAYPQPIIPANDGTNTQVVPMGDRFEIQGGSFSGDGANLFHSFEQFGLDANQIADFLANPQVQNILSRVVGGNPSEINGLIRVTGSDANFYLMNPAGIIFGPNAQLDTFGDFTATTANGIQFGDRWFNATGFNDYAPLIGNPEAYGFTMSQPGSIVNGGNLGVQPGQNITLIGGTAINTGTVSAPGGQIVISAVTGRNIVRIEQPGNLLSIELEVPTGNVPPDVPFSIASLYDLLTTGNGYQLGLSTTANGEVLLTVNDTPIQSGDAVVRNIQGENALLSATNNLTLVESQLLTGENLQLLAGNTVFARDTTTNPFLAQAGGNLYIQGNQEIDILTLNHPLTPFQSGGDLSLVSDGNISGDARYRSGSNFEIRNLAGGAGNFISFYDPIITSGGDVRLGDYTGVALKIEAAGSIFGGDITITGPDTMLPITLDPDANILINNSAFIARAGVIPNNAPNVPITDGGTTFTNPGTQNTPAQIRVGDINTTSPNFSQSGGPVILQAPGDIETGDINTSDTLTTAQGGDIDINSGGEVTTGNLNTAARSQNNSAIAGNINITATDDITTRNINASAQGTTATGGRLNLQSGDDIQTGNINTSAIATNGDARGGDVDLQANDRIQTRDIDTFAGAVDGNATAGNLTLQAGSRINTNNIDASALVRIIASTTLQFARGGQLNFTARDRISTDNIDVSARVIGNGITQGGTVDFRGQDIITANINARDDSDNPSGQIRLQGNGIIANQGINAPGNQISVNSNNNREVQPAAETLPPTLPEILAQSLSCTNPNAGLPRVEQIYTNEYTNYFGRSRPESTLNLSDLCDTLAFVADRTETTPAIVYAHFVPVEADSRRQQAPDEQLELILITTEGQFVSQRPLGATREVIEALALEFIAEVADIEKAEFEPLSYLPSAQQLYQYLIAPLEGELQQQNVENLVMIVDETLRSLPLAALHTGTDPQNPATGEFLVERYSLSLMPSLNLTDLRYTDIRDARVLAMGASEFAPEQSQTPLPFVPLELAVIPESPWQPDAFLNEEFTRRNLIEQRNAEPYGIIHLATHAAFQPGSPDNSFIQLWDDKLRLPEVRNLRWNDPRVSLLVLSACQTALGDREAELGFAGLAFKSGVKSVLGSLWYVRGEGTLHLMAEFYNQLSQGNIKAEALQSAQVAMLEGRVRVDVDGRILLDNEPVVLTNGQPLQIDLEFSGQANLPHPHYWAGFTLIGSPW
ncbi:MAG: CHAT domain-containing protein [Spirulinaceae cyanobacterium]